MAGHRIPVNYFIRMLWRQAAFFPFSRKGTAFCSPLILPASPAIPQNLTIRYFTVATRTFHLNRTTYEMRGDSSGYEGYEPFPIEMSKRIPAGDMNSIQGLTGESQESACLPYE